MIRTGFTATSDNYPSAPIPFIYEVGSPEYSETWMEGLDVYYNPHAKIPLNPVLLPGALRHFLQTNGILNTVLPDWYR